MNAQTFPRRFATVPDAVTALLLADDDFAERAALLLDAHYDVAYQASAIMGTGDTSPMWGQHYVQTATEALCKAKRVLVDALNDLRMTVATERGLWNGVDPLDIDLVTTRKLIAEHARGRVPHGGVLRAAVGVSA